MNRRTLFFVTLLLLAGCDGLLIGEGGAVVSLEENLATPPVNGDGWETSDLQSEGIDAKPVRDLIARIQKNPNNIHSFLIARNGRLVADCYFTGWDRLRLHALRSVSKSFTSTLVGIAVNQGKLDPDQKVADFLPEYKGRMSAGHADLKIRHLLTMTAGIDWDEENDDLHNDETAFDKSPDRLGYLFGKQIRDVPGQRFEYNSALPVVEATILFKATGLRAPEFAQRYLFDPLRIDQSFWRTNENDGHLTAVGPLLLKPRDMAKLGQLFLDSGQWNGQQIISKRWVRDATSTYAGEEVSLNGYGFHWWTAVFRYPSESVRMYFARGSGGQYVFVIPQRKAVVVFTGGNYPPLRQEAPVELLRNTIIPALRLDQ